MASGHVIPLTARTGAADRIRIAGEGYPKLALLLVCSDESNAITSDDQEARPSFDGVMVPSHPN
jgi:hypothetical protein